MGALRTRMERELKIRGLSPATQKGYISAMTQFVKFYGRSPDQLNLEHVKQYLLHLTDVKKVSKSHFNHVVFGLRFFYQVTLGKNWNTNVIAYQKVPKKLPVVLNRKEVVAIFNATKNLKHRTLLMLIYSAGLRVSEAVSLRVGDIDSQRMNIHIHHAKGDKDRMTILAERMVPILRDYWKAYRAKINPWLFPSRKANHPLSVRSAQNVFKRSCKKTGILKSCSIHSLRHSFATHMLEDGGNIRVIQRLLGHRSLSTTMIYTHVAKESLTRTISPFDTLSRCNCGKF